MDSHFLNKMSGYDVHHLLESIQELSLDAGYMEYSMFYCI